VSTQVFIAFDVETTGLVPGVDRLAELAAVSFTRETTLDAYAQLVNPGIPMPAAAGRVNGITDEMLREAPPIESVLPDFLSFLGRGVPVAHNAIFDVGFLSADIEARGLPRPEGPVIDTRGLARRAFPGRFSYSLENLVRDLGINVDGAHRARADAHACRLLFLECLEQIGGDPSVEELAAFCGPRLDLAAHAPRVARTAAVLQDALADGACVDITYRGAGGEMTQRRIRPISFSTVRGSNVIVAYCMLRNDTRTFQLASIEEARRATVT
jgi:DNA polymerase III subunit epsilon